MTQLTDHFSLEEMCRSSTAERLGIKNDPNPMIVSNLGRTARGLEEVRSLLGHPIYIDSGYRCPYLNRVVGGAANSQHMVGMAVDFTCPGFGGAIDIARTIAASGIVFDQLIQEGSWVHISFSDTPRRNVLTAHFGAFGTTYTQGA